MDSIIGTQIGIYNVLSECTERAKDGHKLYNVECRFCGFQTNMKKFDIGVPKKCVHVLNMTDSFVDYSAKWDSLRLSKIFSSMKRRCYYPEERAYRWYGAKGIKICDEWLNDPKLFNDWAVENGYNDKLTIDRIDENKDYCPENCRWVTRINNAKYKSTTHIIDIDGVKHSGKDWARVLGLPENTINKMFKNYDDTLVEEFIRRRLSNPSLSLTGNQSWFSLYGLT